MLSSFADRVAAAVPNGHLVLAGPDVSGVTDDPEGRSAGRMPHRLGATAGVDTPALLPGVRSDGCWRRERVIVNALQRHATVVVQKSLFEGFGLTVTEAMWKGRPVLASPTGGIQDQIVDGRDGLPAQQVPGTSFGVFADAQGHRIGVASTG